MNRLVIIGNGFDLAHGLKTSYKDFIRWYLDEYFKDYFENNKDTKDDGLLFFEKEKGNDAFAGNDHLAIHHYQEYLQNKDKQEPWNLLNELQKFTFGLSVEYSPLLNRILKNIQNKEWNGIESDYYELLKKCVEKDNDEDNEKDNELCIDDNKSGYFNIKKTDHYKLSGETLNNQLDFLRDKLAEYLNSLPEAKEIQGITKILRKGIEEDDIAVGSREKFKEKIESCEKSIYNPSEREIDRIMFLNFNYTNTVLNYGACINTNQIHGQLTNPKSMIFGYGDEMDKESEQLENRNENELMKNFKSIKYVESDNYRNLLQYIEVGPFQVYTMGHSCGNSDRTLLNTIFEHKNCISIKPFYHKRSEEEGDDDYLSISQNIYRNFKDKALFRDRVVNKKQCRPLPQAPQGNK